MKHFLEPFVFAALVFCLGACADHQPHAYTNALAGESSPYLLQHAHNPVNWHPWGDAALEAAQRQDKLLLISIGYASCHWCHVMERESFSDTLVAAKMNAHFLPIKVDREERPDIDQLYMSACQLASQRGCGWPLNIVALPDGRPVWAGTYYPKQPWLDVLDYFIELWQQEPDKLRTFAQRLSQGIRTISLPESTGPGSTVPDPSLADSLAMDLKGTTDMELGGRTGSPKFPMPAIWRFLLQYHVLTGDAEARAAVEATLDGMAAGGLYDLLGGGFSRYATDANWRVPHFEKMLYDNAQLVSLYAKAYQLTGKPRYAEIVKQTLAFVQRELTDSEGGCYASLDADSESEEGKFYTWTTEELDRHLPEGPARKLFYQYFNISEEGNWESGRNILRINSDLEAIARGYGFNPQDARARLQQMQEDLFLQRQKRPGPRRDDKRISAWNALMQIAWLDAYHALGDEAYLDAALKNAAFVERRLAREGGSLLRTFPAGQNPVAAFLEDYALMAAARIDLYQATFDPQWLDKAVDLVEFAEEEFYDDSLGLYRFSPREEELPVSPQYPVEDNVLPSGNAVMAGVLTDLSHLLDKPAFAERAKAMVGKMAGGLAEAEDGAYLAYWGQVFLRQAYPTFEVAIVGPDYRPLRRRLMRQYLPQALFLGGAEEGRLELLQNKRVGEQTLIYVCRDKVCRLPQRDVASALALLREPFPL